MKNFNLKDADWSAAIEALQERAGYHFRDPEILRLSLTHSSYAAESPEPSCQWNERLEFLGDAVLQLVITEMLYRELPTGTQEGELTRARSLLVDEPANARNSRLLGLDVALLLGKGDCMTGSRERDSILGDAYEAFLGAIFLDGGLEAARAVIQRRVPDLAEAVKTAECNDNPKGTLQEYCLSTFKAMPVYRKLASEGPSHAPTFVYEVLLPDGSTFKGSGVTKKSAEQDAAKNALKSIAGS